MAVCNKRHDLIAITISDPREHVLPDVGFISLREAIIAANNTVGLDQIQFNIPDPLVGGAHTIQVGNIPDGDNGALPDISASGWKLRP